MFDLRSPERSPFPSDRFTVADDDQNTGRRVNLPMPGDCAANASECEDRAFLNQLDGFNMQARMSVPFNGDIDATSVNSSTVFLVKLADSLSRRIEGDDSLFDPRQVRLDDNSIVGINNIVWDRTTHELSFRPDVSLDQHTTYALVVTTGVRDTNRGAIGVAEGFRLFGQDTAHDEDRYFRRAIQTAEWAVRRAADVEIAALSVFTTQTATHMVERVRDAVQAAPAPALDFGVGPAGVRAVFSVAELQSLTHNAQITVSGPLTAQPLPNALTNIQLIPGAVATVAFGKFTALDFTARATAHIAPIPTRTGTLAPTGTVDVAFDLLLPSGTRPRGGWPVVLASHGLAVLSINAMGHGNGPRTTMTARRLDGTSVTFATPGCGYDLDGGGTIDIHEPRYAARPYAVSTGVSTIVQTAGFYMQLVRAIQAGVDADGDGTTDLDASRIYYVGASIGGAIGEVVFAYEPAIRAAVFASTPGSAVHNRRLAAPALRVNVAQMLGARTPSLLNSSVGLTQIDGVGVPTPYFNESLPLRNQPPLTNPVTGAIAIQHVLDHVEWAEQVASPVAFAPRLRLAPAPGVAPRPFIHQIARSDQSAPNPPQAEIIRAGDFADRVTLYRHDLNFGLLGVPAESHLFLSSQQAAANYSRIGFGAQHQVGTFFASDGATVTHPTPTELWEVPVRTPVPEDLFFLPRSR